MRTEPHSDATLTLARQLIRQPSLTPDDAGCQEILKQRLQRLGFHILELPFGAVQNFWASLGDASPRLVFAGHTDVVATGPLQAWRSPPFEPTLEDGLLRGRGAADMKGALAAMIVAVEQYLAQPGAKPGSVAFLITSDEEGLALDGTRRVVHHLQSEGVAMDYCIIGEPSSEAHPGDTLRNGRRGSLSARLRLHGLQGHIAYPHLARNPIHAFAPVLQQLSQYAWDEGNRYFPATQLQFSNLCAGTGAANVIPGQLEAHFNIRFNTEHSAESLQKTVENILLEQNVNYDIEWILSGLPFLTSEGSLIAGVRRAITQVTGLETKLSTAGGTSDGRFIAPTGCQVVELGLVNATVHQVDECVSIHHLEILKNIYLSCLEQLLQPGSAAATGAGPTP